MSSPAELNPLHFYRILHSMLRQDETAGETERSKGVMIWVSERIPALNRMSSAAQQRVLDSVWQHFHQHKYAPSRVSTEQMVREKNAPQNMLTLLEEYDRFVPQMVASQPMDMDALLDTLRNDWTRVQMTEVLRKAASITNGPVQVKPNAPPLHGASDAMTYLMGQLSDGVILEQFKTIGGEVNKDIEGFKASYLKSEEQTMTGRSHMRSGIRCLDNVLQGFKYGEMVGILGYAGSRKSAIARTIGYSVAGQGYNVLHIPLEETYDEVRGLYGVLHSHSRGITDTFGRSEIEVLGINNAHVRNGTLNREQKDFLFDVALPHFRDNLPGKLIVRQPVETSWESIKRLIEMENQKLKSEGKTLDMVILDYLTLCQIASGKPGDSIGQFNQMIKDAKAFCLSFDGGRGICLVTPVQGSRKGYEDACAHEGRWDKSGIRFYNEFETSLNICIYTHLDDELQAANRLKIGTCKTRYTADIPPTTVDVHPLSGCVVDPSDGDLSHGEEEYLASDYTSELGVF